MMNPNQPPQPHYGGPSQQPQQQKGCWGRNWKWIVPGGCLALLLGLVALVAGIFLIAMSAVKSSDVYQEALRRAQASPAAVEQLGEPIKDGWMVKGNVKFEGGTGQANFEVPLSGPKNSGTLYVEASRERGDWMFETLDLAVAGGGRISLLESGVETVAPPVSSADSDNTVEDEVTDGDEDAPPPPPPLPTPNTSGAGVISGGVLNGKAISKPEPAYPPVAKAARASGMVTVQVLVNESGEVVSASAVSGHPLLQQAAVAAARQARFSPTLLSGKPVKVSGVLTYNFVLQ
jgi:TonB family protein